MGYPAMDLQSLSQAVDLREGTDLAERTLQFSFIAVNAALQALNVVDDLGTVPEVVHNASQDAAFATALDNLITALVSAMTYFNTIWDLS